ncbi:protelomerase family protein [Borrelia miyamotoi]|uniref:Protelomerase family protein n=3 Tax=Borreliaceae TaxID=1643685 RepID=A0AAQ3AGQ3_9SPIR|nr:protelomerase family protein [Borrelia miyamotoi]AJA67240.1 telomere resolvase [Borrelia miyamotoi LB-2001]AOW96319.1 Telomere resolvase ResT [Borrelia miyamotoi]QTL84143.1 Telomere resolvase ResT [Borrelia miyamotoi]WAZ85793.1 protelomerase family protein [Borrelia miyamotoi]WAZ91575.1 protelomerase family protein [Borrelia miyamotoi]
MSLKINIKKDLEFFRKNLEEIYMKYLKCDISYSSLNKNLKILAEKHKSILLRKDKFTNLSIILNLSKTRKIIKEYINLSVIEEIRKRNKFLFFWVPKDVKALSNIDIKDLCKIEELIIANNLLGRKVYFESFLSLFKSPEWLNNYSHHYKISKINSYRREQVSVKINLSTYIEIIKILLHQKKDIRLKFYGVLMATGRRPVEIMKVSKFYIEDSSHILMKHIAKKKEHNLVQEIVFPTFADSKLIIDLIEEIRYMERTEKFSKEIISSNLAYSYNRLFRKIFENIFEPEESVYFCRRLYSRFSYLAFAPKNMELNLWITTVLGHEHDDIITAFHYNRYVLENLDNNADLDLLKLIKRRIYTYVRRKTTYSVITMQRLKVLIEKNSIVDDNYVKTLHVIKDLMLEDGLDELEMIRGLNVKIRKIFKQKYGYNYNYAKLGEYLAMIFGYDI